MNSINRSARALAALVFTTFFAAIFSTVTFAGSQITISDPWVRAAPPNAPALAAFMLLENSGHKPVNLISAHADGYGRIELHRTMKRDGMMKMILQKNILVPAHGKTVLKPGSWHVMLIQPERVPQKGETVHLTLKFDNGQTEHIDAIVRPGNATHGVREVMHGMGHPTHHQHMHQH